MTTRYKYIFTVFAVFLSVINIFGQQSDRVKHPKYIRVSSAYGYLVGQEYSLNLITSQYPKLEINVFNSFSDIYYWSLGSTLA